MSTLCCQHDLVDWVTALGPTVATLFTAWVAYRVYSQGERAQRLLTRPRLSFVHGVTPNPSGPGAPLWDFRFRNSGQSTATITSLSVRVDGVVIEPQPLEQGGPYWTRVLVTAGLTVGPNLMGWMLVLPEAVGGGSEQPLASGTLVGNAQAIMALLNRVEVRVMYRSAFGESWTESSKSGELP